MGSNPITRSSYGLIVITASTSALHAESLGSIPSRSTIYNGQDTRLSILGYDSRMHRNLPKGETEAFC